MPTKDNIHDLLDVIESQSFSYFLVIVSPKPSNSSQDELNVYHNLPDQALNKLSTALKKAKIYKDKRQDKNKSKKNDKKDE